MTLKEAIEHAENWAEFKKEVRRILVKTARSLHPRVEITEVKGDYRYYSEIRKLYDFPGDLNEQRLLNLIKTAQVSKEDKSKMVSK